MPKFVIEYLDVLIAFITGLILYLIDANATVVASGAGTAVSTIDFDTKTLAGVSWLLGIMLAANRIAYLRSVSQNLKPVAKVAEILDLSQECDIDSISALLKQYLRITEADFTQVKEGIVEEASQKLLNLATTKTSDSLAAGEYYKWLYPYLKNAGKNSKIRAVSTGYEWEDTPAEKKFMELSLNACKNNAKFERVFILTKDELKILSSNPTITDQGNSTGTGIVAFFVDKDYLKNNDSKLMGIIEDGYIEFDGRVAMMDVASEANEVRGNVTMNETKLNQLVNTFDMLKESYAKPLSEAIDEINATEEETPPIQENN